MSKSIILLSGGLDSVVALGAFKEKYGIELALTFDYGQKTAKSEIEASKKIIGWRCKICGYEYEGAELPADYECPICGHPAEDFEPIYEK